jgi:hypothetical protein
MNEGICDLRFAICDLLRASHRPAFIANTFSLTPRFSGVWKPVRHQNRFSGFLCVVQTAEAVQPSYRPLITPLNRGVNEKAFWRFPLLTTAPLPERKHCTSCPQIANRKSKF